MHMYANFLATFIFFQIHHFFQITIGVKITSVRPPASKKPAGTPILIARTPALYIYVHVFVHKKWLKSHV